MKQHTHQAPAGAYYGRGAPAVVVRNLEVTDPAVVAESRRWSTGQRGTAVGEEDMADVGARTAESTTKTAETTTAVVNRATEAMQKAASEAKNAIAEAGKDARQSFAGNVDSASRSLLEEVHRLVGGDNPEVATRLGPVLERFGHDLDTRIARGTSELLANAAKQFDPDDSTSPMAKHARELPKQQETLSVAPEANHRDLAIKVDELTTAVKVTVNPRRTTAAPCAVWARAASS